MDAEALQALVTFAAVYAALDAGHAAGDNWMQTDDQAANKDKPGWFGHWNCLKHVLGYGATQLAALGVVVLVLDLRVSPMWLAIGMTLNLVTHYVADRRAPLVWLAERLPVRKFVHLGEVRPGTDDQPHLGTGQHALDQSLHKCAFFATAVLSAL